MDSREDVEPVNRAKSARRTARVSWRSGSDRKRAIELAEIALRGLVEASEAGSEGTASGAESSLARKELHELRAWLAARQQR